MLRTTCFSLSPMAVLAPPHPKDAGNSDASRGKYIARRARRAKPLRTGMPKRRARPPSTSSTVSRNLEDATTAVVRPPPPKRTAKPDQEQTRDAGNTHAVVGQWSHQQRPVQKAMNARVKLSHTRPEPDFDTLSEPWENILARRSAAAERRRERWRQQRNETYWYNLEMRDMARKRDLSGCLELLDTMKKVGAYADAYTYSTILQVCMKLRATETAVKLYGRMRTENVRIDEHVIVTMMGVAGRAQPPDVELLRALFHRVDEPNLLICNVFLDGLSNAGLVRDVEGVLRYMSLGDIKIDDYTISSVAKVYARAGDPDRALERVDELGNPPATALNTIMASYAAVGRVREARKVFERLGPERTAVSYNVFISAHRVSGDIQAAFDIFDRMLRDGLEADRYTIHALMKVCLAGGDAHVAFETYKALKHVRQLPNQVSYRLAARATAMSRDALAFATVVQDIRNHRCELRADVAVTLTVAAIRCGDLQESLEFAREFLDRVGGKQADSFFEEVTSTLQQFEGPAIAVDGLEDNDAEEVVRNLHQAWRLVAVGQVDK